MANRLQQARRLLKSSDPEERGKACGLLFGLCSKSALRLGLQAIEDEDPGVRQGGVLAVYCHPEGLGPIEAHLLNDPDESVRRMCANFLGGRENPEVIDSLRQALNDPSEEVQLTAYDSLYKLGDREPLRNAIHHPSPSIRLQACKDLIFRWKEPSQGIIEALEALAPLPMAKEHDEKIIEWRAFLQQLCDEGQMTAETRDLNLETWRSSQITVAELIEEAKRLMAGEGILPDAGE